MLMDRTRAVGGLGGRRCAGVVEGGGGEDQGRLARGRGVVTEAEQVAAAGDVGEEVALDEVMARSSTRAPKGTRFKALSGLRKTQRVSPSRARTGCMSRRSRARAAGFGLWVWSGSPSARRKASTAASRGAASPRSAKVGSPAGAEEYMRRSAARPSERDSSRVEFEGGVARDLHERGSGRDLRPAPRPGSRGCCSARNAALRRPTLASSASRSCPSAARSLAVLLRRGSPWSAGDLDTQANIDRGEPVEQLPVARERASGAARRGCRSWRRERGPFAGPSGECEARGGRVGGCVQDVQGEGPVRVVGKHAHIETLLLLGSGGEDGGRACDPGCQPPARARSRPASGRPWEAYSEAISRGNGRRRGGRGRAPSRQMAMRALIQGLGARVVALDLGQQRRELD